jgi:hypothetical protein
MDTPEERLMDEPLVSASSTSPRGQSAAMHDSL